MNEERIVQLLEQCECCFHLCEAAALRHRVGDPQERAAALHNIATFSERFLRAISSLQALDPGFADLSSQMVSAMRATPQVRSWMQVATRLSGRTPDWNLTQLAVSSAGARYGTPPKGALAFFTGDRLGGSGWELELPGGVVEKFYVTLPPRESEAGMPVEKTRDICFEFVRHIGEIRRNAQQYFA